MTEWEGLLRLAVAAVIGGAIGFERETLDKSAGLRTHMLVCMGAALFMVCSVLLVHEFGGGPVTIVDPTRIASTIVTGVGFLGGGIIFKDAKHVRGLTTAAGLWVAAAIGMAAGAGFYITAAGGGVLTLIILNVLGRVESSMNFGKRQQNSGQSIEE
ncbi:MAG: MgtC/SapB family protein [Thermomicrobiales bacterium]